MQQIKCILVFDPKPFTIFDAMIKLWPAHYRDNLHTCLLNNQLILKIPFWISNLCTILLYFLESWTMNENPAKWPNGWAHRKKLFSLLFLGEVKQWMNTRREIVSTTSWQKWDDGWIWGNLIKRNRIMELRQVSWAF